jgi:hypothetical protein
MPSADLAVFRHFSARPSERPSPHFFDGVTALELPGTHQDHQLLYMTRARARPCSPTPDEDITTMNRIRSAAKAIAESIDHVLDGVTDAPPIVVMGPVVWHPDRNGKRLWYFLVGSAGPEEFRIDQMVVDKAYAEEIVRRPKWR